MTIKNILALSALLLASITSSVLYAKVPGITTGEQLQAAAEKRTKVISTAGFIGWREAGLPVAK